MILSGDLNSQKTDVSFSIQNSFSAGPAGGRIAGVLVLRMGLCILGFCVLLVPRRLLFVMFNVLLDVKNLKAVCGSYSTAALRHIVLLPK